MKKVTADIFPISKITEEDAKNFIHWAYLHRDKTRFDAEVLRHPRMCITRASMDGEPSLYIPIRAVLMFGDLTPDPSLNDRERAVSIARIGELVESHVMPDTGMHDCFATVNDDDQVDAMAKRGWTEIKGIRLMRKRFEAPQIPEVTDVYKETADV